MLYIFDFDGTMVDSKIVFDEAIVEYLKINNCYDEEKYLEQFSVKRLSIVKILKDNYFSNKEHSEIFNDLVSLATKYYSKVVEKPNFTKYLKTLKGEVIVLTRNNKYIIDEWLNKNNLKLEVISEQDINLRKDTPEIYDYILSKFSVSKDEVILFEDNHYNISAAIDYGIKVVAVNDYHTDEVKNYLKEKAYKYIENYNELM